MKIRLFIGLLTIFATTSIAQTSAKVANVYDVTKSPYNADASGATASDVAIQKAINAAAAAGSWGTVIYFPTGTYILNNPLFIGTGIAGSPQTGGMIFEGESREKTNINVRSRTAFSFLGRDCNTTDYTTWYGNSTYHNEIKNLTINKITSSTTLSGGCAIDLLHANGTLIDNVTIRAYSSCSFDCGIRAMMDYLTVTNCNIEVPGGSIDTGISIDFNKSISFNNSIGSFFAVPTDGARVGFTHIAGCGIGVYAHGRARV